MDEVRQGAANQADGDRAASARGIALKPLRVSGIVVSKPDLIEALRLYAPGLSDIQVTEDGEHFWLILGEGEVNDDSAAKER